MVRLDSSSVAGLSRFDFDCPACRGRLSMDSRQRNALLNCTHCRIELPGPDFRLSRLDPAAPPPRLRYRCRCDECDASNEVCDADIGLLTRCTTCKEWFRQPPPAWEQWRRPVARIFTAADQRRSLHHLMFAGVRSAWTDETLDDHARRRFEYYCGGCGHLHRARVWDIASQQRCHDCRALFVVPCPPHRNRLERTERLTLWGTNDPPGLFCPRCGIAVSDSDPTRQQRSYCGPCRAWF